MQEGIDSKLVIGLLAHVDSGKTTLAESLLYTAGSIRKLGRVDHKNAFLDNNEMERARGITIFSKQALLSIGEKEVTLLDTPGHIDFSAEMERTLQVLDYAILVINGSDNIEGHVKTLWKLLSRYNIPTFIFVNKMDQNLREKAQIMEEINKKLDSNCVDFSYIDSEEWMENIAMCDESLMNKYIDNSCIDIIDVIEQIEKRNIFPCFFGSALKIEGIQELLEGIGKYTKIQK